MEFGDGAKFHGTSKIPWNSMEPFSYVCGFHGVPWNSMELGAGVKFHGTFKVPWNSMEPPSPPKKVPWNSMELLASSMEFHGTVKY